MARLPIRFINLDRATERRAFLEGQLAGLGLDAERVATVDVQALDGATRERLKTSWERPITDAELSCFLSHRRQWERIAQEDRPALVLEDDAVLSPRLPAVIEAAARLIGLEVLNLEDVGKRRFLRRHGHVALAEGVALVPCARDKAGSGAYILWPAGARKLLAGGERTAGLSDSVLHGSGLKAAVCEPPVSMQLSVLEEMGVTTPVDGTSFIQGVGQGTGRAHAARAWRYGARRVRTQMKLLPRHLERLFARSDYRRVRVEREDFSA